MNRGIFKTIVYYDCLDYPLTREELDIFSSDSDKTFAGGDLVDEREGFYFLKGRESLIEKKKERDRIAEKKWNKMMKAIPWLRLIPYIRLVFASGSLALRNTTEQSDLDVLVVVKSGRIWTSRFLAVVLLGLLGLRRRRGQKVAPDKICMNHFITDKSLYIPRKSIYTAQLYARLVPIFGEEKLVDRFCEANSWIKEYIPKFSIFPGLASARPRAGNFQFSMKSQIPNSKFPNFIKKTGEKILDTRFGDWLEAFLRKYQLRRINNYHLTHKPGGRVKADDESLEFHPDSPELRIIERYNKTMQKLGFPELGKERDSGLLHDDLTKVVS